MTDSPQLIAALEYALKGWHVFPTREKNGRTYTNTRGVEVTPRAKMPYVRKGLNAATTDESQIRAWWNKIPDAGIGVNCGASGLFVIDIDTHKGRGGLENFMRMGIPSDRAFQCITPSGGLHLIYSGDGKTTTNDALQIDTRGMGGYIIAPPSFLISGEKIGHYAKIGCWAGSPMRVPSDAFEKLGIDDKKKLGVPKEYNSGETSSEKVKRVRTALEKIDMSVLENYDTWVKVGMSLRSLGEDGFSMWEEWTQKYFDSNPSSKRIGTLRYKWGTFLNTKVTLGTLFFFANSGGNHGK